MATFQMENGDRTREATSTILLSLKNGGKVIPYGRSEDRPDGSRNYGFKPLKGKPHECALIPEAQDNEALKAALTALNDSRSPFFTVGCEKAHINTGSGHWIRGYLEFAFNYAELVADAHFYFKLFFYFNRWYRTQNQYPVTYYFEIEEAHFGKVSAEGFTMTIWITTRLLPSEHAARNTWGSALDAVVRFLMQEAGVAFGGPYTQIY